MASHIEFLVAFVKEDGPRQDKHTEGMTRPMVSGMAENVDRSAKGDHPVEAAMHLGG
jgi:hypothetical protein